MKRVLITGKNGYIGTSIEKWLKKNPDEFQVTTISVQGNDWKRHDFSVYDVVLHVAGLAHKKETKANKYKYDEINYHLTKTIANKAKISGVPQFVFFSSMSVFGKYEGVIDDQTVAKPISYYGESKLKAENFLLTIQSLSFKVVIIRPPIVYGHNCKGNYVQLSKFAKKTPIFPDIDNQRSMIYIDNLCEFTKCVLLNNDSGVFHPQNKNYVCTSDMIFQIAKVRDKKIRLIKTFNILLKNMHIPIVEKIFGSLVYDYKLSKYPNDYNVVNFIDSIKLTERGY